MKISIIVPCYKVADFLPQCVESLTAQTYKNIEIILVDDGSPDDTGELCDEYAKKDARVKVVHKQNGGLVSARNAGYYVATGDWIMYVDGDDWLDEDCCQIMMDAVAGKPDVDIVFWKCVQELGDKSIKGKWEWPCQEAEHLYLGDECKELARNTLVYKSGIATAYCKMIRASYAKEYGIKHDDRLKQGAEGLEFSLRAFYHAQKALYVNNYSYHYLFNPNSISKKVDEKNTKYLLDCLNVIQEDIEKFDNKEAFTKSLYQRIAYIVIAIAMRTYFHPSNKEAIWRKVSKYAAVIKNNPLLKVSVDKCNTEGMDKQRKLTLFFIRKKMYFMLAFVAWAKQFMLKRGKYNY